MRGSDSGISLQSRDETKSKILFNNVESTVEADLLHGLKDLPFDMPKLRRRKIPTMNVSFILIMQLIIEIIIFYRKLILLAMQHLMNLVSFL